MIESCYWKEELWRISRTLKPVRNPKRWSERAHGVVERDVTIGFFLLRRLIELHKLSSKIASRPLRIYSCKSVGKSVNLLNRWRLWDLYALEKEQLETKSPLYIANQFVHAYTSVVRRDASRNWSEVYVVSDFDRQNCVWRVPIETIRSTFEDAASDYPNSAKYVYDPKKRDYRVSTD